MLLCEYVMGLLLLFLSELINKYLKYLSVSNVRLYFLGAPKSLQMVMVAMKLKDAYSLEGKL